MTPTHAYQVVHDFEKAVCDYTGAPYCVSTNSCSMAILLAVAWHLRHEIRGHFHWGDDNDATKIVVSPKIEIPKRTYVSVPMSIIHAGGRPTFRDEEWAGAYQLKPLPVWDCARYFTSGLYRGKTDKVFWSRYRPNGDDSLNQVAIDRDCSGQMLCVSFHASKTLGDTQGGAILLDDEVAAGWLRRARFDGRYESLTPAEQAEQGLFKQIGYHCYMSPDVAARLLLKLHSLPRHNDPLPNDEYPDLSTMEIFR